MQDISKRIKQLRQKSGMTQEELANRLHVTRQAVSNWETRKTRPDIDTLEALAQAFAVDVTQLLYGEVPTVPRVRRWLPTAVFGGMTAVWLLLAGLAVPAANEIMKRTFSTGPVLTLRFVCTILSAAFFPLIFSALSVRLPSRNRTVRRALLASGSVLSGVCAAWWLTFPLGMVLGGLPYWLNRWFFLPVSSIVLKWHLSIAAGGLLYLGIAGSRQPAPDGR